MALTSFHPTVQAWFARTLGQPTEPQARGWPPIARGEHVLLAAPTGSGKTLAAFLWALDGLLRREGPLPDRTEVLYVSPLRALSNDVQRNLERPLAALREADPSLPEVRVLVRTGDTTAGDRARMSRRPPHVLVTTPESLYILLTSRGGRAMLSGVRTVIVDEIHALARDKRGSHLSLSLERLEALAGPVQRVGLSATVRPLDEVARLLVGEGRPCTCVDVGHRRALDLAVEVPPSPLSAVCSHETWGEIYERMAALIDAHRTTLIFVGTRKLAERLAARLSERVGPELVGCHHGSLSKERRLQAEQKLKDGAYRALVATASLELGIDIGDVDLVLQVGSPRSIATLLQRVGRAGHGVDRVPKGRLFPLTLDELVEAGAALAAIEAGELDLTPRPPAALDVLAQQIVAACVGEDQDEDALFALCRRAWPYRALERQSFDRTVALHTGGRYALLHRDGVGGRLMATRRARIPAVTSGGAIPDTADYQVRLQPEDSLVGSVHEDFAVEANAGDIFQLGNASWRVLKIEPGRVLVADAQGEPPTLPFWIGEAPGRTRELSARVGWLREACEGPEWLAAHARLEPAAAEQVAGYLLDGRRVLGTVPTQTRLVAERFFDETGGMQLVVHAPFGGRINRAFGLALRKCFCRGFGFELQAAATEDAILISLGPHHSFPLEQVFSFLHSHSARAVLVQAILASPFFTSRWRWNVVRSLLLPRLRGGKPVPPAIQRMRADDLLVQAFPQVMACGETLPAGDIPVPEDHPLVQQTVEDTLHEALDVDGFLELLRGLESGAIERVAVDVPEPSAFAQGVLAAQPYAFLDDAPLEERRTQAVRARRTLDPRTADALGALDPAAVERVRAEAWPSANDAEEVHEALLWMGYLRLDEVGPWGAWIAQLRAAGRVVGEGERLFAAEAPRDPLSIWRGRLAALGPVFDVTADDEAVLAQLEAEGVAMRTRIGGRPAWCDRRLLARMHRYTLETLRAQIEPVSAADFLRFLAVWQHVDPAHRVHGPAGVLAVVDALAGFEIPAGAWETSVLPARVERYRRDVLDPLCLSGQVAWARLWTTGTGSARQTPIALVRRDDLESWLGLATPGDAWSLRGDAQQVLDVLARDGACFLQDLQRRSGLLPSRLEQALTDLVGLGLATCDAFSGLRRLLVSASAAARRRRGRDDVLLAAGRWSVLRRGEPPAPEAEFVARALLRRTGVVFRRVLERERIPVPWRIVQGALRRMELRGEVRGGRFVRGFSGEQFALPQAVETLRRVRRQEVGPPLEVSAADPLNLRGILTPDERVASNARARVRLG